MSGFTNFLRELDNRAIGRRPLCGWITNNNDPTKNQRCQVRIADLHDQIEDADLPWFGPAQLAAYSGSANIGDHGPMPDVGAKIWVSFDDDSQYHGTYGGGVADTTNQIPEFTKQNNNAYGYFIGASGSSANNANYYSDYPSAFGSIDGSGNLDAISTKRDIKQHQHVSGTGHMVDGKGNVSHVVNGNATRSDNPNAAALFPVGLTSAIFGNINLYVSGNITISASGNTTISANGTTTVNSIGQISVLTNDEIDIMSSSLSKPINITSKYKIALDAPLITSSIPITTASGKEPAPTVASVKSQTAPTPRSRPTPQLTANDVTY